MAVHTVDLREDPMVVQTTVHTAETQADSIAVLASEDSSQHHLWVLQKQDPAVFQPAKAERETAHIADKIKPTDLISVGIYCLVRDANEVLRYTKYV